VGKVQAAELFGEGTVVLDRVIADRQDLGVERLDLGVVRPQGG
jgi:hypothetical protein